MIIGILCGQSKISQRRAIEYYDAINEVGHAASIFSRTPLIFNRPHRIFSSKEAMFNAAKNSNCEFFMACTDALGDIISQLNQLRGKPFFPPNASHKDNLHCLNHGWDNIKTWKTLDEVPDDIPIFIKPINGSGGLINGDRGGDPWSYVNFNSKKDFFQFIENYGGIRRFHLAQLNKGWMGEYIFQEYIPHEYIITRMFMNDGSPSQVITFNLPHNWTKVPLVYNVDNIDDLNFANNIPWGTFTSLQALPTAALPKVNDFNIRCVSTWSIVYKLVCPNFYTAFFNNLLNFKNTQYNFKYSSYTIIPPFILTNHNDATLLPSYDIFANDSDQKMGIILHD